MVSDAVCNMSKIPINIAGWLGWVHRQINDGPAAKLIFQRKNLESEWSALIGPDPSRYSALIGPDPSRYSALIGPDLSRYEMYVACYILLALGCVFMAQENVNLGEL